jgi:hypothetical protein
METEDNDHGYIEFREAHEMATGIRALDGHYWHCAAARHHTIDFQVVFHTHAACFWSIVGDVVNLCCRKSIVGGLWVAQSKARYLCR